MMKLKKKRANANSVSAYHYSCGICPDKCKNCGCSCPPTGISSGTVMNQLSSSPTYQNTPQANEQYRNG